MLKAYFALLKTGILGQNSIRQVCYLFWCYLRFGVSLYTLAAWAAKRYSSRIALQTETEQISYTALLLETDRLASGFYAEGLRARETLGLCCHNRIEFVQTLLAASRLGIHVVLLNPHSSQATILEICQAQKIKYLVHETEFSGSSIKVIGITAFPELKKAGSSPLPRCDMGKLTILSSGSTGSPKAIRQKPQARLNTLTQFLERFKPKIERSTLLALPMFHGHGLATLILSLMLGTSLSIFAKGDTKTYLSTIAKRRIDAIVLVPTILYRILEQAEYFDLSSVITIVSGSAPLEPQLARRTQAHFGLVLYNFYGSSEAGMISFATPQDLAQHPDSVGLPMVAIQILGLSIYVSSQNTGDTGYLKDGRLYLTGRQDNQLNCGGLNVQPEVLEQQISSLEYVVECAVRGIPDAEYGTTIDLFVVLTNGFSSQKLQADLEQLLPRATRPKRIRLCSELPRNAIGKLERHRLW